MADSVEKKPLAKHILQGALLGLATGFVGTFLSWLLWLVRDFINILSDTPIFILTAGVCFGLGLGWMAKRRSNLANWAISLIALLTPIIYYGAYLAALIFIGDATLPETLFSGAIGGTIGSGLIATLCALLVPIPRKTRFIIIVTCVGAVAGAVAMPAYIYLEGGGVGLYIFHMIWHASVLAAIFGGISGSSVNDFNKPP